MGALALASPRYCVADLERMPQDGKLRELVHGEVVEWDVPTYRHGFFVVALGAELRSFVRGRRLGQVVGGETMVSIQGSGFDARGADVAFFSHEHRPPDLDAPATFTAPDLVIEILSPIDRADRVLEKVQDWLRAGVRLLWCIDPVSGMTTAFHGSRVSVVSPEEELSGEDVLPGFQLRLRELLDEVAQQDPTP